MNQQGKRRGFDAYAANYGEALAQGLPVSGQDKVYLAPRRIARLARSLEGLSVRPRRVLDFGGRGPSMLVIPK